MEIKIQLKSLFNLTQVPDEWIAKYEEPQKNTAEQKNIPMGSLIS